MHHIIAHLKAQKMSPINPKLARYCRDSEATVERLRQASEQAVADPETWIADLLKTSELLD